MWSLCTVLPGNDNISLTTDRHDVNCDGLLISSRFQVTAGWFFMTYWNEWKLTAALCGGEMPLKDCVMWKSFNDVYDSIYLFIQHWFNEVSRQFFFTKSHPYIIVFLFFSLSMSTSTHFLLFPLLHLTLWMYPVTARKVYKSRLTLWCHWVMWIHIIHLLLCLYFAKLFLLSAPLKGSQTTV